jgi:hypothetical protein
MKLMQTVYCVHCRGPIDPANAFCRSCGKEQRPPATSAPTFQVQPDPVAKPHGIASSGHGVISLRAASLFCLIGIAVIGSGVARLTVVPGQSGRDRIREAETAGNAIPPFQQPYVRQIGELQDLHTDNQAILGWLLYVPGVNVAFLNQQNQIERCIALMEAAEQHETEVKRIEAYGGIEAGIRLDKTHNPDQERQQITATQWRLPVIAIALGIVLCLPRLWLWVQRRART